MSNYHQLLQNTSHISLLFATTGTDLVGPGNITLLIQSIFLQFILTLLKTKQWFSA